MSALPPNAGIERLFNHLVSAGEKCWRYGRTQRHCGLEVDYKLELGCFFEARNPTGGISPL
jgi:hypothetical protein